MDAHAHTHTRTRTHAAVDSNPASHCPQDNETTPKPAQQPGLPADGEGREQRCRHDDGARDRPEQCPGREGRSLAEDPAAVEHSQTAKEEQTSHRGVLPRPGHTYDIYTPLGFYRGRG